MVAALNSGLEDKMQWLDAAKKKWKATEARLEKEKLEQDNLEQSNKNCETNYKEAEQMMLAVEKDIWGQKNELFK
jgi:hypothetical protein